MKLSRRVEADLALTHVTTLEQEKGYEPEALLNFVALLGWSPQGGSGVEGSVGAGAEKSGQGQESDVLSLEEMIDQVSLVFLTLCLSPSVRSSC